MENKEWFIFTTKKAYRILIYYVILFLISLFLSLTGILNETFFTNFSMTGKVVLSSIGFAISGSVIFYSKKIYKACINLDFTSSSTDGDKIREFGISAYFIFRPLFSIVFSFLLILSLKLGVKIVTVSEVSLNNGFIYLTSFLSFFCGYASGDILDVFEKKGKGIVNKIFNKYIL